MPFRYASTFARSVGRRGRKNRLNSAGPRSLSFRFGVSNAVSGCVRGDKSLWVVTTSTLLFYAAERGHNPNVNSVWDALVYCTTCLSVGYGDIFAMTPIGKIIGSTLMTMGPALSGATLDGPHGEKVDDHVEKEILATLQEILKRMPPATPATP